VPELTKNDTASSQGVAGAEIVLDNVVKSYPGQKEPAVKNVSMTIPAGEIVVLVGPSGCGKTTTMRMINRLIEPTSGTITIGGTDALKLDADELRRGIGYSIQQAGLMDEPFGAVDPITRGLLQDELLRLQTQLKKTIVFVTHDFGEAVKLGDRIAVLGNQSTILQYDTPEAILANPADETVAGFVGAGASLKQLTLMRVRDVEMEQVPTARITDDVAALREKVGTRKGSWGLVLDERDRPYAWVGPHHLGTASGFRGLGDRVGETVSTQSTLQDALEALLAESSGSTVVTGGRGEYVGMVNIDTLIGTIRSLREDHSHDHDDAQSGAHSAGASA
jgi:ABC-type proline/glycine betaine transport system ATPase subunit